jgi:adenylate cyclase
MSVNSARRLAAIMFTDIVGYTALSQRDEFLSLAMLDDNRKILRPTFIAHHGKEIKTIGDAFLVEFSSALDAVRCGYDIQRKSREFNLLLPREKRVLIRIGIHLGDVVEDSEGDILGDAVNVASRIQSLAQEGGVCLTQQVFDHVRNKFELPLKSIGKQSLKNVDVPIEVYKMVMPWDDATPDEDEVTKTAVLDKKRIAILPFSNISSDPNDEYFADGMTEELISSLSKIRGLRVISRTSVMRYKTTSKGTIEIGQELRAENLLEGSVRKVGNRLRIAVQLIDANTDEHTWSETYDRELQDVFAIQSEISTSVAKALKVRLLPNEKEIIEKIPTRNQEAYTLYLKGRFHFNKLTGKEFENAIEYFQLAVEEDPSFSLAFVGLADSFWYLGSFSYVSRDEAGLKAKQFASRALEIDDMLADAHLSMAQILLNYEWDFDLAENEFQRSIELQPSFARAYAYHALWTIYHADESEFPEAFSEIRRSLELDPMSTVTLTVAASALMYAGHYDEAIEEFKKAISLDPNVSLAHDNLGLTYVQKGLLAEGIAEIQKAVELTHGRDAFEKADLAYALTKAGRITDARKLVEELQDSNKYPFVSAFALAAAFSALGEKDKAFEWLDRAYAERSTYMYIIVRGGLPLDNIRSDERFENLLRRVGLKR